MLIRNFEPNEIFVRCRVCKKAHSKKEFPTLHRVCNDCAHNMNWRINPRKKRKAKLEH